MPDLPMMPKRIRLSRAKGWRMPPNTIKVDRTTRFGNPFIVGTQGKAPECVYKYVLMICGYICISEGAACCDRQDKAVAVLKPEAKAGYPSLHGKNLACWCEIGKPCHADVLLYIANKPKRRPIDLAAIMAGYGYRMDNGTAVPIDA